MENPWADPIVVRQSKLLAENYYSITKKKLIDYEGMSDMEISFFLYHASFALVSHGIEADPIFNYANLKAQELWSFNWNEFTQLPSRLSAEIGQEKDRSILMEEVKQKGYIGSYSGVRVSKSGRKFEIQDVLVFNLKDHTGKLVGQAAMFEKWKFL